VGKGGGFRRTRRCGDEQRDAKKYDDSPAKHPKNLKFALLWHSANSILESRDVLPLQTIRGRGAWQ